MKHKTDPIKSVVVDAPVAAEVPPVVAPARVAAAPLELLEGDEIIQLSIKPSPWLIAVVSVRTFAIVVGLGAALSIAMRTGSTPEAMFPFHVLTGILAVRVGLGTLQWASRLYVLTNRRVLRFRGVFQVDLAECRLTKIRDVGLEMPWYGRWLRLGTVRLRAAEGQAGTLDWNEVARPQEMHEILTRAIRKAQNGRSEPRT